MWSKSMSDWQCLSLLRRPGAMYDRELVKIAASGIGSVSETWQVTGTMYSIVNEGVAEKTKDVLKTDTARTHITR
jgi:hypothetical protein